MPTLIEHAALIYGVTMGLKCSIVQCATMSMPLLLVYFSFTFSFHLRCIIVLFVNDIIYCSIALWNGIEDYSTAHTHTQSRISYQTIWQSDCRETKRADKTHANENSRNTYPSWPFSARLARPPRQTSNHSAHVDAFIFLRGCHAHSSLAHKPSENAEEKKETGKYV